MFTIIKGESSYEIKIDIKMALFIMSNRAIEVVDSKVISLNKPIDLTDLKDFLSEHIPDGDVGVAKSIGKILVSNKVSTVGTAVLKFNRRFHVTDSMLRDILYTVCNVVISEPIGLTSGKHYFLVSALGHAVRNAPDAFLDSYREISKAHPNLTLVYNKDMDLIYFMGSNAMGHSSATTKRSIANCLESQTPMSNIGNKGMGPLIKFSKSLFIKDETDNNRALDLADSLAKMMETLQWS